MKTALMLNEIRESGCENTRSSHARKQRQKLASAQLSERPKAEQSRASKVARKNLDPEWGQNAMRAKVLKLHREERISRTRQEDFTRGAKDSETSF